MSKKETDDKKLIELTNRAANELKMLLTDWRNNDDSKKRAKTLSYWLITYIDYLKKEKDFEYSKLKEYSRGDVIKVNLGFNVGSEEGGLHYAVVVDNCNTRNSPVVTVIPLTSQKEGKKVHENDVALGKEIYDNLKFKCDKVSQGLNEKIASLEERHNEIVENMEELNRLLKELEDNDTVTAKQIFVLKRMLEEADREYSQIADALDETTKELDGLDKIMKEITNMKQGSIALVSQITTVSKMKIYDPKSDYDVLAGVKLSNKALDVLNQKIKDVYIR